MAKGQQGKKASTGTRNPDRKCGKAWKKHPKKPAHQRPVTEERHIKNLHVENLRFWRKQANKERRAAEEAEYLAILKAEEDKKEIKNLEALGYGKSVIKQKSRRPARV